MCIRVEIAILVFYNPVLKYRKSMIAHTRATMAASGRGMSCLLLTYLLVILSVSGISMAARPTRQLQKSSQNDNKVLRTELIHRDHVDSPLNTNASHSEKIAACLERSDRRRARLLRSSTDFQSPVTKDPGLGEFLMKISLGTPPQERIAILDTGSDLVWLQCQCGNNCLKQPDPLFDPNASTSYSTVPCDDPLCAPTNFISSCDSSCRYSYKYGGGDTTQGHFVTETITLTDATGVATAIPGFYFGCGEKQTGKFQGTDGLIGFGQGAISLPSQMSTLYSEVFSYCLVLKSAATKSASTLLFGSTTSSAGSGLTQTQILNVPANPTFYYVPMAGITVDGVDLGIPPANFMIDPTTSSGGVIFDSGTTLTYLDQTSINAIVQKYRELVTYPIIDLSGWPLCFNVSQVPIASVTFPTMAFQFTNPTNTANVDFPLANENSFIIVDNLAHQICLAFNVTNDFSIIGNIAMGDHLIEYDLINQVIGWKQQVC